ncbi:hypothetical protein [Muribaculum intestinale]|uniref:hypothetical protein n=1 Tax=Muribaculum intestinale TaxID=1796646 RepID=UPI003F66A3C4
MRLDGRRQSSNISDRRGRSTGRTLGIGGGIVGAIIVAIITLMRAVVIGDIVSNVVNQGRGRTLTPVRNIRRCEDQRLAELASKVLAALKMYGPRNSADRGGANMCVPRWCCIQVRYSRDVVMPLPR